MGRPGERQDYVGNLRNLEVGTLSRRGLFGAWSALIKHTGIAGREMVRTVKGVTSRTGCHPSGRLIQEHCQLTDKLERQELD